MKGILFLLLLPFSCFGEGMIYYVKAGGGTGSGLDHANAWSFAKLNATVTTNDLVLFNRGDVFQGVLIARSGTNYSAYGTGEPPKITGMTDLTSWADEGGGLYYTIVVAPDLKVVTLDGVMQPMGRYPNTGMITYSLHSGSSAGGGYVTSSVSAGGVPGIPFNPAGAELAIRLYGQIMDRHLITSRASNTLNLDITPPSYGSPYFNNDKNEPQNNNGMFVQNHLGTLDQAGEWYNKSDSYRFYMHFGAGTPYSHSIQVATQNRNIDLDNKSNVTFTGIDFEGTNGGPAGNPMNNTSGITFRDCRFTKHYQGIDTDNGLTGLTIASCEFEDILSTAVHGYAATDIRIDSTRFNRIGIIRGAGGSGDGHQIGINLNGSRLQVSHCNLDSIGYHGIILNGDTTLISYDTISFYGLTKSDCGGIYDYQFPGVVTSGKVIRNNRITDGVGDYQGNNQQGQAAAVYMDANVTGTLIKDNYMARGNWGGNLLLDAYGITMTGNVIENFPHGGLFIIDYQGLSGLNITGNTFTGVGIQPAVFVELHSGDNIANYGVICGNTYGVRSDPFFIDPIYSASSTRLLTLSQWKAQYFPCSASTSPKLFISPRGKLLKRVNKAILSPQ